MSAVGVFLGFLFGFAFGVAGGTFYYYYAVKKIKDRYSRSQTINIVNLPEESYTNMNFKTDYIYNKKAL